MSLAKGFGRNMFMARRRANLSQSELAERAEMHVTAIGYLERGIRAPRVDSLLRLCEAMEIDADVLLDGLRPDPKPKRGRKRPLP